MGYISKEGLQKLQEEVNNLKKYERPSISKQIGEARDKGDLSENAEYDAAKEAQGFLELKISKLEEIIRDSKIVDISKLDTSKVQIMSKVKIENVANKSVMSYHIVGESESDLKERKISVETPIAKGLLGKKVGDIATVKIPSGEIKLKILEISI